MKKLFGKYPVLFYFCGDAHEIWAEPINNFIEFTMGCLVQGQNIQAAFSIGELRDGNKYSIEAHKWDARMSEWGEYTQFNRKFRMWTPRISQEKLSLSDVVVKTRPLSPSLHFVGGNLNVRNIEEALRYNARTILLHGIGGMGKTELCRFLFEKYTVKTGSDIIKKVGWITYHDTLKDSFFGQFPKIVSKDVDYYWNEVKRFINELGYELLLIIDNADEMTEQEFLLLKELGCRMILTARKSVDRITTIELEPLPMSECRELYRAYSRDNSADNSLIDNIVTLAARHTLAIELLAKVQYYDGISAEELYEELQKKDFDLSDIMVKIPYIHNPENNSDEVWDKRFMEHIEKIFDLTKIRNNPEEMRVMQLCSLLAAGVPIPMRIVKEWLELTELNTINKLVEKSWLIRNNQLETPSFTIHPLISSVIRYSCMPTEEVTGALIRKAADDIMIKNSETHMDKLEILPHAVAVAKHLSICSEDYIRLLGGIAGVYLSQAEYVTALQYYENVLELQKERVGEVHPDIAKICNAIAGVYDGQGRYDEALTWLIFIKI